MKKWLTLTLFYSATSFAGAASVDVSYFKGDYAGVYHEAGQKVQLNAEAGEAHKFFLGYEHAERHYSENVEFSRDALLAGDTWVFPETKAYVEMLGSYAGDTFVGPQVAASLVPHTSHFVGWDLSLGLHYAKYETGEVQSLQPTVIYFISDYWRLGASAWFYEDHGWHTAYRGFTRWNSDVWSVEASIAGGENREDIGLIDPFKSYSLNVSYTYKSVKPYLNVEDYQGDVRRGSQWGAGAQWHW